MPGIIGGQDRGVSQPPEWCAPASPLTRHAHRGKRARVSDSPGGPPHLEIALQNPTVLGALLADLVAVEVRQVVVVILV